MGKLLFSVCPINLRGPNILYVQGGHEEHYIAWIHVMCMLPFMWGLCVSSCDSLPPLSQFPGLHYPQCRNGSLWIRPSLTRAINYRTVRHSQYLAITHWTGHAGNSSCSI